jgi:hypothetical protein
MSGTKYKGTPPGGQQQVQLQVQLPVQVQVQLQLQVQVQKQVQLQVQLPVHSPKGLRASPLENRRTGTWSGCFNSPAINRGMLAMTSPINRGSGKGGRGASSVPWMEEAGRRSQEIRSQKSAEVDKEKSRKKSRQRN